MRALTCPQRQVAQGLSLDVMGFSTQDESLCRAPTCPRFRGCRAKRAGSPGRKSHSHGSKRRPGSVVGFALTLPPRRVAQRLPAQCGASAHAPTAPSGTEAAYLTRWALMGSRAHHVEWHRGCLPDVMCLWSACATRRYRRAGLVARSRKRAGAACTAAAAYGRRCRHRRRRRPRRLRQEVDARGRRRRYAAAAAV